MANLAANESAAWSYINFVAAGEDRGVMHAESKPETNQESMVSGSQTPWLIDRQQLEKKKAPEFEKGLLYGQYMYHY